MCALKFSKDLKINLQTNFVIIKTYGVILPFITFSTSLVACK